MGWDFYGIPNSRDPHKKPPLIKGKLYLATRSEVRLCGQCYRNGAKPNLKFNVKEKPGQSLKPAKRNLQVQNLALGKYEYLEFSMIKILLND